MHFNFDDDPVDTEVKGKLVISCIISELPERNYKVRRRLMKDRSLKEVALSYLIGIN